MACDTDNGLGHLFLWVTQIKISFVLRESLHEIIHHQVNFIFYSIWSTLCVCVYVFSLRYVWSKRMNCVLVLKCCHVLFFFFFFLSSAIEDYRWNWLIYSLPHRVTMTLSVFSHTKETCLLTESWQFLW